MPWAESAGTATRWATDRAIDGWMFVAGDMPADELNDLATGLLAAKHDGAAILLVVPPRTAATPAEEALATVVADGPIEPVPAGLFAAAVAAEPCDMRRIGVLGRSEAVISAGLRAGAEA